MVQVCRDLGFAVNPSKVTPPASVTNFLGIDIDSVQGVAHINPEHLQTISQELSGFRRARSATKHEILSLIGKLHFICRVCPLGRAFLHCMIDVSKKARYLHHRIKLSTEFCGDIEWWLTYLPTWNGVSFLYNEEWTSRVSRRSLHLPFLYPFSSSSTSSSSSSSSIKRITIMRGYSR